MKTQHATSAAIQQFDDPTRIAMSSDGFLTWH